MKFSIANIWQRDFFSPGHDFDGLGLCFAGMTIVFVALVLITLFITFLPWVLAQLDHILPQKPEGHSFSPAKPRAGSDESEKVAAIAYALRQQRGA